MITERTDVFAVSSKSKEYRWYKESDGYERAGTQYLTSMEDLLGPVQEFLKSPSAERRKMRACGNMEVTEISR